MTTELSNFAARLRGLISHSPFAVTDFERLALELFALQFGTNAPYRRFCEARAVTPLTVTCWPQIPAMPAAAFKEFDLTCLTDAARSYVFHSSGTTDQRPSRHYHCAESLAVYEAALLSWFQAHRCGPARLLLLTPPPAQAPNSSLVHMFDVIRKFDGAPESAFVGRTNREGAWELDFEVALTALHEAGGLNHPVFLLGTAFSFVHLLDEMAQRNLSLTLPANSAVMETGGYKGRSRSLPKSELHALIGERLGVPDARILCEYGMSELSSQAYDRALSQPASGSPTSPSARQFAFPPWARVQVMSPETGREVGEGETGILRIFDLANVFSVLAVQTEDLAIRHGERFELIGRAQLAEARGCSLMVA